MAKRAQSKSTAPGKRRGRPGRVGNQIFDQVQRLIRVEKMTRTGAFKSIAEKNGRNAGTVAANYYRVARQRGVKLQARRRRGTVSIAKPAATMRGAGAGGRVVDLLQQLANLIHQQSAEISRLQQENQRFQAVRRLLVR